MYCDHLRLVKEDRFIEEKCSALFQIFRQEIQSELKSEILDLRTEIEKLKVSLVEKQATETATSAGFHRIKMTTEVTNESSLELSERRKKERPFWFGFPNCPATCRVETFRTFSGFP